MIRISLLTVLFVYAPYQLAHAQVDHSTTKEETTPLLTTGHENQALVVDTDMIMPAKAADPSSIEPYPEYDVSAAIERQLAVTPADAATIILDYTEQCKGCKYPVASVVAQEIFERESNPYQFLVWQDVNKEIDILVKKIPFRSSSWTQIRVFESADKNTIIIDSKLLDADAASDKAKQYSRPSEPAFAILHSRWTITAIDPAKHKGSHTNIQGIAGGKGQGISKLVPKSFMRKELKAVMDETLDFVKPAVIAVPDN
jgi:hypothetical protein